MHVDLPNDADALALVKGVLEALHGLFSDGQVAVDRSVSNAARIARVPGTLNPKGDNLPERPYRPTRLLDVPDALETCPREMLERIAALAPAPESRLAKVQGTARPYVGPLWDFDAWIAASGLKVTKEKTWGQESLYELAECPWNADHQRTAHILRFDNGALSAGCFHDSCRGKGWHDLRDAVEPGWDSYKNGNTPTSGSRDGPNLTSNYKREPLEVRLAREVNAAELRSQADADPLEFLPVLGKEGFVVMGWSHLIASYPKVGKTELLATLCQEWATLGQMVLFFTEEPMGVWKARLNRRPSGWEHVTLVFALGMQPADILERIETGHESVVVIDTVRNLLQFTDEIDNSKVAQALTPYVAAARQAGKSIIFLHHDRKGGGE